ncbi:MAG: hypothetical protein ACREHD_25320 [Pirellulales bacterium]
MNPTARTCFVLSAGGLRQAGQICTFLKVAKNGSDADPDWDAASGNLTFGGTLVMHVPERAAARRNIFAAAEAGRWKNPTDNPFADMPPARRSRYLRRLLDQLNHHQSRLHFSSALFGEQGATIPLAKGRAVVASPERPSGCGAKWGAKNRGRCLLSLTRRINYANDCDVPPTRIPFMVSTRPRFGAIGVCFLVSVCSAWLSLERAGEPSLPVRFSRIQSSPTLEFLRKAKSESTLLS